MRAGDGAPQHPKKEREEEVQAEAFLRAHQWGLAEGVMSKAYNNVPHDGLLRHMAKIDMPPVWIQLLRRLYRNNTIVASFGGRVTDSVPVRRGPKQGCHLPQSCLCCMPQR